MQFNARFLSTIFALATMLSMGLGMYLPTYVYRFDQLYDI